MNALDQRFVEMWLDCRDPDVPTERCLLVAQKIVKQLRQLYAQPWRIYHDFGHIEYCLEVYEECGHFANHPNELGIAIWFHACIYDLGASDNEARSRDWFLSCSEGVLNNEARERIADLIMDTCFPSEPMSHDGRLIVDIDLSNLRDKLEVFMRESKAVMDELSQLKEQATEDADQHLANFFSGFLAREHVFFSDYFRQHYDHIARSNIEYSLQALSKA